MERLEIGRISLSDFKKDWGEEVEYRCVCCGQWVEPDSLWEIVFSLNPTNLAISCCDDCLKLLREKIDKLRLLVIQ